MAEDSDKRQYPRFDIKGKVRFRVPEHMDISMATLKNISGGGMCLLTENKIEQGQKLSLEFGLPNDPRPILSVGEVMWIEELDYPQGRFNYRIGVKFVEIDEDKQKKIAKFVAIRLRAQVREEIGGEKPAPGKKKPVMLVIDDDKVTLQMVKEVFRDDFEVITANGGYSGIEKAKEWKPDIILLDIIMPDLDGFSTLMMLKDNENTAKIPVIMLSVVREKSKVFQALQHGATDYMIKPFTSETLITKIRKLGGKM